MKKVVLLVVAVLLVSLLVVVGCAQPAAPGETAKTVTTTVTAAATTVTAPAKTVTTTVTAAAEEPEVIKWTMMAKDAAAPASDHWANPDALQHWMFHEPMDRGWAEWINDVTDGRLEVTVVEPNAVFPHAESVENIGAGVIQAVSTSQGYLSSAIPATYVGTGLSMMWPDANYPFDCYYNYGLLDKLQPSFAEYNVYFIPTFNSEVGGFATTFTCDNMASVAGKKLRFFGAHGKFVEALGGLPVTMTYADVYMGLKLGTIDGTTTGALALDNAKLKEVVKGWASNGLYGCTVNCQLFNMDALNALPDDIQKIVRDESKYYLASTVGMTERLQQQIGIENAVRDYGIEHWVWSADEQVEARELAKDEVWPFYGAKSAMSQELLDMIIDYQKLFGLLK